MPDRRSFIVAGAGSLLTLLATFGVAGRAAASPPSVTSASSEAPHIAQWSPGFTGADLAIGESLDLRRFVTAPAGAQLTFSLNPGSAPIAGILSLSAAGMLTRLGPGTLAGVLIDTDDGT